MVVARPAPIRTTTDNRKSMDMLSTRIAEEGGDGDVLPGMESNDTLGQRAISEAMDDAASSLSRMNLDSGHVRSPTGRHAEAKVLDAHLASRRSSADSSQISLGRTSSLFSLGRGPKTPKNHASVDGTGAGLGTPGGHGGAGHAHGSHGSGFLPTRPVRHPIWDMPIAKTILERVFEYLPSHDLHSCIPYVSKLFYQTQKQFLLEHLIGGVSFELIQRDERKSSTAKVFNAQGQLQQWSGPITVIQRFRGSIDDYDAGTDRIILREVPGTDARVCIPASGLFEARVMYDSGYAGMDVARMAHDYLKLYADPITGYCVNDVAKAPNYLKCQLGPQNNAGQISCISTTLSTLMAPDQVFAASSNGARSTRTGSSILSGSSGSSGERRRWGQFFKMSQASMSQVAK
ncbi:hypothetical protein CXG81DRAFT_25871 [Caulochytrium protostelioides]|uniref:F-box domain-containing protein n=1 Tax=Caulochytrium protostelioides TaxID=1555241 RepID=A0A4P9X8P2_9FUNG|nr:hypothetical protein CXG81DRAFT_25871 [Caulochytrium protostelioides]|eukprot:RKP01430.1 hypothetical protein CXG81DRAFT_25871 [Caulochytrium protostelioides]